MSDVIVCRRVEDTPGLEAQADCADCGAKVWVEGGVEQPEKKVCIHCAYKTTPDLVLFVELPPDEYGNRSMAKSLREIYEKADWHKTGRWHNQKWVLARQE